MFPLEYPFRVLRHHHRDEPVVMDPFCGRGTTLFAARRLGLTARGVDSSPVAVAIARAKLCRIDTDAVLKLAREYIEKDQYDVLPNTEFFQLAFEPSVLRKICAIRSALLKRKRDSHASALLRATMLGCLHGPRSKSPKNQAYLSNQMPRTFGSKPGYSVRYWKANQLTPPYVDVVSVLQRKLSLLQYSDLSNDVSLADVRLGDSRFARSLPTHKRDFSVVITSPPYYGMKTYVEDQWLRNWFLGGPDHVQLNTTSQLRHTGQDIFIESLGAVWKNMARSRANSLHLYIRFGTIPSRENVNPKIIVRNSLEASGVAWRVVSTRRAATASAGKRQANHMSVKSNAATEFDFHICRR